MNSANSIIYHQHTLRKTFSSFSRAGFELRDSDVKSSTQPLLPPRSIRPSPQNPVPGTSPLTSALHCAIPRPRLITLNRLARRHPFASLAGTQCPETGRIFAARSPIFLPVGSGVADEVDGLPRHRKGADFPHDSKRPSRNSAAIRRIVIWIDLSGFRLGTRFPTCAARWHGELGSIGKSQGRRRSFPQSHPPLGQLRASGFRKHLLPE
jgi:hypothetical protein